jgi:spermidine synthase
MPCLLVLFVGSGCSALIYEVVWLQLLQLVIGSSAVSVGVLLGTFMGGTCLGSLALPRVVSARRHPLRVYAVIELGIGVIGLAVLFGMPHVDRLYAAAGATGFAGLLLRAAVCAACLLPPTVLMGATLPAVARWVEATPRGVSWLGFFYGGNIAGAVFGCLLAGFYLLRVHDMATATYVAAAVNGAVGLTALVLATRVPHSAPSEISEPVPAGRAPGGAVSPYVVIALSGLCALGAEVVWTRALSLLLGATVYTFSIILAVFLAGLGIGSGAGAALARKTARPRILLGWCQLLLAAAVAWAACAVARTLPYWRLDPAASAASPWAGFAYDLARCAWALLPPACLWGASFPLALAAAATSRGRDPGRVVGGVYAANTVGAIVGAIGFGMLLIPNAGTQNAQRLLVGLSALAALIAFAPRGGRAPGGATAPADASRRSALARRTAVLVTFVLLAGFLAWRIPKLPDMMVAYGRQMLGEPRPGDGINFLYVGEGLNASVAVTEFANGARSFHVSGKVEASSEPQDMRLQRMLGHLPALVHPRPRSVLVVGCGAGVTAGSFVAHPEVERIVICEIEPLIPQVVARYFGKENHDVLRDPRVQVVYDDARHFLQTTRETFDVITSDPIHPWVKGAAVLYSREYFELCKRRLNPGGVVSQWVPLYESSPDVVKSELATFFDAFPEGTVWSNDVDLEGYDTVVLGQVGPPVIDVDGMQRRLSRRDHTAVAESLDEVGFGSVVALLATYAGRGPELRPWLRDAQINRDGNLRLQYLAGMERRSRQETQIYDQMLAYRTFPVGMFLASDVYREAIRSWMGAPR